MKRLRLEQAVALESETRIQVKTATEEIVIGTIKYAKDEDVRVKKGVCIFDTLVIYDSKEEFALWDNLSEQLRENYRKYEIYLLEEGDMNYEK